MRDINQVTGHVVEEGFIDTLRNIYLNRTVIKKIEDNSEARFYSSTSLCENCDRLYVMIITLTLSIIIETLFRRKMKIL